MGMFDSHVHSNFSSDSRLVIILGSASKSRRQILRRLGFKFSIKKANLDEKSIRHKNPKKLVLLLANAKADALLAKIKNVKNLIQKLKIDRYAIYLFLLWTLVYLFSFYRKG